MAYGNTAVKGKERQGMNRAVLEEAAQEEEAAGGAAEGAAEGNTHASDSEAHR